MKEYAREYPLFSLCGLNCGLCPRYQCEGASKCPGCGGRDFHMQHPSCAVITCSKKHGSVEYCFQCGDYPCRRYESSGVKDSFITYRHVVSDMQRAMDNGIRRYQEELNEKVRFLEYLIDNFNDGRKKNFYCIAVNLLDPADLSDLQQEIEGLDPAIPRRDQIKRVQAWITEKADSRGIDLKLRK